MIRETKMDRIFNFVNDFFLIAVLMVVLYPLIYVISASISDPILVNQGKMWLLPKGITFEGFKRVFQYADIWVGYRNTIFYTLIGTMISLFLTFTCAYPLSRKDLPGRNIFMTIYTITMFFSGGLIPTYLLVKRLGFINKIWSMIIPGSFSVWNLIIVKTYFQNSIPKELQEASMIDGCSNMYIFINIILPLSTPIIAVMTLFYGVGYWNAFFNALIYLSNRRLFPLQLILREILIQQEMSAQMMMNGDNMVAMAEQAKLADIIKYAVIIVSTIPVLIIYPFLQKYFVHGIMVGAIKG
ncbi:MAG: carbohydrate ABC transporter permease [Clostridiales bacterium]|nr:carbohydrate ABC transporter permease [Clostridiales bacterium]